MDPRDPRNLGIPKEMKKLKAHIFICTHERPEGHIRGCCKLKDSESLIPIFKQELSKAGLAGEVRAQRAGCLNMCEFGPSVVIYPDGIWYGRVQSSDIREIVQSHLVQGEPVKRLLIDG
jgi:(2Fe-2S) ferredoxin